MSFTIDNRSCTVKCCLCGVDIQSNGVNMCDKCLIMNANIAEGIEPSSTVTYCKQCNKLFTSSKHWVIVERESLEELGIMLKMIKGVKKNELVDAKFIWTEPHSRRIIIELSLRKEIQNGVTFVGTTRVTFKQVYQMCPDCLKEITQYTWEAIVQIRQHIEHKRTLLYLEQLLVTSGKHSDSIGVEIVNGGLDFYFATKTEASLFLDFVKSKVLCMHKNSKQLHSQDLKSNLSFYRYSYFLELPPICRDDLVLLPKQLARDLGIPLVICYKVSTSLCFIHPSTLKTVLVNTQTWSKFSFSPLLSSRSLKEYTVLDIQPIHEGYGENASTKFKLAEVEVIRSDLFGVSDDTLYVRSHLGAILHVGDAVLGYDLKATSINSDELDKFDEEDLPDVILVCKPKEKSKKSKSRKSRKEFKKVKENTEVDEKEVLQYEIDRERMMEEIDLNEDGEIIREEDYEVIE